MSGFRRAVAFLQEGSLYVLLFLLPFSKAAVEVFFGVLFLAWLVARLDPRTRRQTLWVQSAFRPLRLAIAIYLAACALSILVSHDPWLSLNGFVGKWLEYLLFTVVVTDVASRPRVVARSLRVLVYAALLVFFEAITQERYGQGFFRFHRLDFFGRMTGPYENPIDLATYLMVIIPLLLTYTLVHRKGTRRFLWILVLTLMVCLGRTEAIGAWFGLGVSIVVIGSRSPILQRTALLVCAGVLLIGGIFLLRVGHFHRTYSMADIGKRDRLVMWQAAMGMIRDRPILGHGVNTFMANYLRYWVGGERQPRYAHNCYLQVAAETGLVGLVSFVALLWLFFRRLFAVMRHAMSKDGLLLAGFGAGLLAFAVQSAVDTNFYSLRQAALFWIVAGLALGLSGRASPARSHSRLT